LKDNILPGNHPVFSRRPTFAGLKMRAFDSKIEWPDQNHRLHLTEHLRTTLPHIKANTGKIHQITGHTNESGEQKRRRDARLQAIGKLVDTWEIKPSEDAHIAMHEHLSDRLNDYELTDLLMSLGWLKYREGLFLKPQFKVGVLETDRESLRYYKLKVETEHA